MVKQNTPGLYDALDALDWASVPLGHQATETGHGRRERRTIQVMDAPEPIKAKFPHVRQVALIERYVTRKVRKRKKNSRKYKTTEIRTSAASGPSRTRSVDWTSHCSLTVGVRLEQAFLGGG